MQTVSSLSLLLFFTALTAANPILDQGYLDPNTVGGSMLTGVYNTVPEGMGEPLNIIISAHSDPRILELSGLQLWLNSLNFSQNCMGMQTGIDGTDTQQNATLDNGLTLNQTFVFREDWGDHIIGACKESINGGNHLKAFQQTSTGAWFFTVSTEESLDRWHDITGKGTDGISGYDNGRNLFLEAAGVDDIGPNAGNGSWITIPGHSYSYHTDYEKVGGLLKPGKEGINHDLYIDGEVAVLTVNFMFHSSGSTLSRSIPGVFLMALFAYVLV